MSASPSKRCLYCGDRSLTSSTVELHMRMHQLSAKLRFASDGYRTRVWRDAVTKCFKCPRCDKVYVAARSLQNHVRTTVDCRLGVPSYISRKHRAHSKGRVSLKNRHEIASNPESETQSSSGTDNGVSPPPEDSSSRARIRRGKETTRTQRALVRGYWNEGYSVCQIGDYLNLLPSATRYAINNDSNDNLDEDKAYQDGLIGDVINVEDMLLDIDPNEHGVFKNKDEDDRDVIGPDAAETDDRPESIDSDSDVEILLYPNKAAAMQDRRRDPAAGSSAASAPSVGAPLRWQAKSYAPKVSTSDRPPQRGALQGTDTDVNKSSSSGATTRKKHIAPVQGNIVRAFLGQLMQPLVQLEDAFHEFGIASKQELDVLCILQDQWGCLQSFLTEKHNVSQLQWMIVKAGLTAHALKLGE